MRLTMVMSENVLVLVVLVRLFTHKRATYLDVVGTNTYNERFVKRIASTYQITEFYRSLFIIPKYDVHTSNSLKDI